jgi:hypothetical protein
MFQLFKIRGHSMSPLYESGDFVLVSRLFFKSWIRSGVVLAFHHDRYGDMVKRVSKVDEKGQFFYCEGLHRESISQEKMGEIHLNSILGVVCLRIKRPYLTNRA